MSTLRCPALPTGVSYLAWLWLVGWLACFGGMECDLIGWLAGWSWMEILGSFFALFIIYFALCLRVWGSHRIMPLISFLQYLFP